MKNAALLLLLITSVSIGYSQGDITPRVSEALRKGDAAALSALMMNPVELTLSGQEGTYASADARAVLGKFFAAHPARDFSVKHQGTSKLDDQYRIGELITSKGTFRVTFFMKKTGAGMMIKQLKIESPDDF